MTDKARVIGMAVTFSVLMALGLALGWYGGADWAVRSTNNAIGLGMLLIFSLYVSVASWSLM